MKFGIIVLAWLMIPVALVVVAFDIAKEAVESKVVAKLEKNT